jgi:hypothetical protein
MHRLGHELLGDGRPGRRGGGHLDAGLPGRSFAVADPDSHADSDPYTDSYAHPHSHADPNPDTYADADPNAYADTDPNAYADTDPDTDPDPYADPNTDPDTYADPNPNPDTDSNPDADTRAASSVSAQADASAGAYSNGDAEPYTAAADAYASHAIACAYSEVHAVAHGNADGSGRSADEGRAPPDGGRTERFAPRHRAWHGPLLKLMPGSGAP